jgi:hypothetical protein
VKISHPDNYLEAAIQRTALVFSFKAQCGGFPQRAALRRVCRAGVNSGSLSRFFPIVGPTKVSGRWARRRGRPPGASYCKPGGILRRVQAVRRLTPARLPTIRHMIAKVCVACGAELRDGSWRQSLSGTSVPVKGWLALSRNTCPPASWMRASWRSSTSSYPEGRKLPGFHLFSGRLAQLRWLNACSQADVGAQPLQRCAELKRWVYAGGNQLPGFVNPREAQYGLASHEASRRLLRGQRRAQGFDTHEAYFLYRRVGHHPPNCP